MDDTTTNASVFNNTNVSCISLQWVQSSYDNRQSRLYVSIIAAFIHTMFWLQIVCCSSVRQKSMQWIYAYLLTDIFLLFRFFFSYLVHMSASRCVSSVTWAYFNCYIEATFDNYFNAVEVYILLALNVCRYAQIAHNRNVYRVHKTLLVFAHIGIYLITPIVFVVEMLAGWTILSLNFRDKCEVIYTNLYVQVFNIITQFALPIVLNVFVIYASVRHVRLTSTLQKGQHHVSARQKYHRSLVIQFLLFYIVWVSLWSPNVIVSQITFNQKSLVMFFRLLNFIEIALDPIIIAALDIRFWHSWKKFWREGTTIMLHGTITHGRVQPAVTPTVFSIKTPRFRTTAC